MGIVLSFIPWFLYWVFLSFGMLTTAAFAGFLVALVLNVQDVRAKKLKVLSLGTLIFFFAVSVLACAVHSRHLWTWVPPAGNVTLAVITLVSILIKKPFTLQYARENVPPERWNDPLFIHANYVITWAWFIAFVLMTGPDIFDFAGLASPTWFKWTFSVACCAGAVKFTAWYRKKSHPKTKSPAQSSLPADHDGTP